MAEARPEALGTVSLPVRIRRSLLPFGILTALLILGAAGVYGWYSYTHPCNVQAVQEASAILLGQMKRYDDVYVVTADAPPDLLVRPVAELQQVLMDTQAVEVPACLQTARDELIQYMRDVIRAFQAYGAGEPDATIMGLLDDSYGHVQIFIAELEAVNNCAPFCLP